MPPLAERLRPQTLETYIGQKHRDLAHQSTFYECFALKQNRGIAHMDSLQAYKTFMLTT